MSAKISLKFIQPVKVEKEFFVDIVATNDGETDESIEIFTEEIRINHNSFDLMLHSRVEYAIKMSDMTLTSVNIKYVCGFTVETDEFEYSRSAAQEYLKNKPEIMKIIREVHVLAVNIALRNQVEDLKVNSALPLYECTVE
ncbi:hypothetical protein [Eikenella corrodens]|jgi:hypothetical protein|uniref:hypothetical protein n=1 Tax=Eikenella corrodens TaxID=539 RepID=UPI000B4D1592|nr:hypothetical protein [Eikenella corrodens]OWP27192.1 hypothetical protein CA838_02540 [Eikenella corrodens]